VIIDRSTSKDTLGGYTIRRQLDDNAHRTASRMAAPMPHQ